MVEAIQPPEHRCYHKPQNVLEAPQEVGQHVTPTADPPTSTSKGQGGQSLCTISDKAPRSYACQVYKRKVDEASRYRVELQAAVADSEKEVITMCTELGEKYEPVRRYLLMKMDF